MSFFSRFREVELNSASEAKFRDVKLKGSFNTWPLKWSEVETDDAESSDKMVTNDADDETVEFSGISLEPGARIRVAPMDRKFGGWDAEHFNEKLQVSSTSFMIQFEAMARECVAIALSPEAGYSMGKTYAIHIGSGGNLNTVIRRWLPSGEECVERSFTTVRVCADFLYKKYWIIFVNGKIFVGLGKPGEKCIAEMDDTLYNQIRPGQDKVKYVGLGNSSINRNPRDLKIRNLLIADIPSSVDVEKLSPDLDVSSALKQEHNQDEHLLKIYQAECAKARARAAKFNSPTDSTEIPNPESFMKWSDARRLRANPEAGFITGIDVTSEEEKRKRLERKKRFEKDEKKRKLEMNEDEMDKDESQNQDEDVANVNENNVEDMEEEEGSDEKEESNKLFLPVEQAWDNVKFIRKFRVDPPSYLYSAKAENNEADECMNEDENEPVKAVPEKIHLFAIDWAAFKQMRSDDVMAYFSEYGPSYIEWIGDLSCNVIFQDKFSAIRAMEGMSQPIPDGSTLSIDEDEMEDDEAENNRSGEGTKEDNQKQTPDDLGGMGWRFCKKKLRKVLNDRFGRRGTTSRLLMRVATTQDSLEEKPERFAKPPPGFTTQRVLGPGSDFPKKRNKKTVRKEERNTSKRNSKRRRKNDEKMDGEALEDKLSKGLSAKR